MAYLLDAATGTLRKVVVSTSGNEPMRPRANQMSQTGTNPAAPGQVTSDRSGGPRIGPDGGNGANTVWSDDPANMTNRPPMAPPANGYDLDDWRDLMGDDTAIFPPTIKTDVATTWAKAASTADGSAALYVFDRGSGRQQWMVKARGGRRHQYADWNQVAGLADWRTSTGGPFQPAGLRKSADPTHPPRIDVHGRVATRLMADGTGALYGLPDGEVYRLVFRGNDGTIRIRREEIPLGGEMKRVLTDTTDGTLNPKQGRKPFSSMRQVD